MLPKGIAIMKQETSLGRWYQRYIGKWIPMYGLLPLIGCCLFNSMIYTGTQLTLKNAYHYDLTSALDRKIPFVPEWVLIYVLSFAFWALSYIVIAREGKEKWYRFAAADMMSRLFCMVFFVFWPTTNIRPQVVGDGFIAWLMRLIYALDAPTNLFPSIHCLVSWFCFIGVRRSKKLPAWYKAFTLIFALLICASTQFTKQHYLVDIPGGILIAELCWFISNHTKCDQIIRRFFEAVGKRLFGVCYYDE